MAEAMAEAAAAAIAPRPLLIVGTASSGPRSRPRIRRPRPAVFCARTTYDNALPRDHRFVATQEPGLQPFFACGVRQRRYMALSVVPFAFAAVSEARLYDLVRGAAVIAPPPLRHLTLRPPTQYSPT